MYKDDVYPQMFTKAIEYLFNVEKGFVDDKHDDGGRTNLGVTQVAYDTYRNRKKLPFKDVKDITKKEAIKLYYEDYWLKSGAEDFNDLRMSLAVFDGEVHLGNSENAKLIKKSKGNYKKYMSLRAGNYSEDKNRDRYGEGWSNRLRELDELAKTYPFVVKRQKRYKDYDTKNPYNDFVTSSMQESTDKKKIGDDVELLLKGYVSENKEREFNAEEKQTILNKVKKLLHLENDSKYGAAEASEIDGSGKLTGEHIKNQLAHQEQRKKDFAQRLFSKKEDNEKKFDENKLYSYTNEVTGDKKIFLAEMIEQMDEKELAENKEAIEYQKEKIGIPTEKEAKKAMSNGGMIHVRAYVRSDGTKVRDYYRSV